MGALEKRDGWVVAPGTADLLDTATGEVVSMRDAGDELLLEIYQRIGDISAQFKEARSALTEEFTRRMDHDRLWSRHVGAWVVSTKSPKPKEEYDAEKLWGVLRELVGDGLISDRAGLAACEEVVTHVPRLSGISALLKTEGEVADRVRACRVEAELPKRYLSVKRA